MKKRERLKFIEEIVTNNEISTQEELTEVLKNNGLNVTQATVSRDINELGIKKVSGTTKKYKYAVSKKDVYSDDDRMVTLLTNVVVSVEAINNLVILKTYSGNASTAGAIIDKLNIKSVACSIAGDDAVLVVARDDYSAKDIVEKIKGIL